MCVYMVGVHIKCVVYMVGVHIQRVVYMVGVHIICVVPGFMYLLKWGKNHKPLPLNVLEVVKCIFICFFLYCNFFLNSVK